MPWPRISLRSIRATDSQRGVNRSRSDDNTVRSAARLPALSLSNGSAPCASNRLAISARPPSAAIIDLRAGLEQIGHDLYRLRFRDLLIWARRPHQEGEIVGVAGIDVDLERE